MTDKDNIFKIEDLRARDIEQKISNFFSNNPLKEPYSDNLFRYNFEHDSYTRTIKKIGESYFYQAGYVYALTNKAFPDLLKIGKTKRNVYERAKEISCATGVPYPFEVCSFFITEDCDIAEREIHETLEDFRVSPGREFFDCGIDEFEFCAEMYGYKSTADLERVLESKRFITNHTIPDSDKKQINISKHLYDYLRSVSIGSIDIVASGLIEFIIENFDQAIFFNSQNGADVATVFPSKESIIKDDEYKQFCIYKSNLEARRITKIKGLHNV